MITGKNNKFIVLTLATAVILIVTVGLLLNDRNAGRYSVTNGKDLDALIETAIQTTNPQICKAYMFLGASTELQQAVVRNCVFKNIFSPIRQLMFVRRAMSPV